MSGEADQTVVWPWVTVHRGALRLRVQGCQPGVGGLDPPSEFRDGLRVPLWGTLSPRDPDGEQCPAVRPVCGSALGQGSRVLGHLTSMAGGCDARVGGLYGANTVRSGPQGTGAGGGAGWAFSSAQMNTRPHREPHRIPVALPPGSPAPVPALNPAWSVDPWHSYGPRELLSHRIDRVEPLFNI